MNGFEYLKTFRGAKLENRFGRLVMGGMAVAILLLSFAVIARKQTVVQIPPGLTEKGVVTSDNANAPIKEAWGRFFASSLGNVTPRTADFTARNVSPYLTPAIYKNVLAAIAEQTKTLKDQTISSSFDPTDVFWVPSIDKVVVSGQLSLRGTQRQTISNVKTYVLGVAVRDYKIILTSLETYDGPWVPPQDRK